jgi:hypothetical protein
MPDSLILDIANNDAFGVVALTDSINLVPNVYGRLQQLGVFPFKGVTTPQVAVEINNGVLSLIPAQPRGGPANQNQSGNRNLRFFNIPHLPLEDIITVEDLEKVRAFGTADREAGIAQLLASRQEEMALKHFITLEYLRMGALKGKVLDATGAVILDLFAEFGITPTVVDFALNDPETDVDAKIRQVNRHITKELKGDTKTYVHALCSPEFFDDLTHHPSVREAYLNYQEANPLREDLSAGWKHQSVFWEEYPGEAVAPDGTVHKFIPSGSVQFFPMGTTQTMRTYGAPANFIETVGTEGLPLYSKLFPDSKLNQYLGLHTQSNPLPICLRPAVLVTGINHQ